MESFKKSIKKVLEQVGVIVGDMAMFIAIALASWALGGFVHWLASAGASGFVIGVLTATEYSLLVLDAVAMVLRAYKHLFKE